MRRHLGLIAAFAAGLLLMVFGVYLQDIDPVTTQDWMRLLSNAALVPGVLLGGIGILVLIAGEGLFDGMKYTFTSMITHLRGGKLKYPSYYDYTQRAKQKHSVGFLLIPGAVFLALAIALTAAYYFAA